MTKSQLNFRVSEELEQLIDRKRIELSRELGTIPSRSDVLRLALQSYLGVDLSTIEVDRRSSSARQGRPTK
jgi:hypothetical protein